MKLGVLIPARLGSSRFPQKVLAKLGEKSVLQHVIDRCKEADIGEVYVVSPRKDGMVFKRQGYPCMNPSIADHNVLRRLLFVADKLKLDAVVRVNGDSPLINPADLRLLSAYVQNQGDVDYVAYSVHGTPTVQMATQPAMPELITTSALRALVDYVAMIEEHATLGAYRHPNLRTRFFSVEREERKTTIDTRTDLKRVEQWLKASR
jgi:spore coat polysaccharide biosynthesis protein SpsF